MSEMPDDPLSWPAPDSRHRSPQQPFSGPPASAPPPPPLPPPTGPNKRTWMVVLGVAVALLVLALGAVAALAVLGVANIKQSASTSAQVASTLPPRASLPPDAAAAAITCTPSTPESIALISNLLAPPAASMIQSRSYTNGRYEVFVGHLVDARNRGLALAMWMIEDGTPYAASSAATGYSSGIEDLTYEVSIGFQNQTGLELQQVADELDLPCPAD